MTDAYVEELRAEVLAEAPHLIALIDQLIRASRREGFAEYQAEIWRLTKPRDVHEIHDCQRERVCAARDAMAAEIP